MELICKDGDLAVITQDEPGLEANVGRFVWVYGPPQEHAELGVVWRSLPASKEPLMITDGSAGSPYSATTIMVHPDAWLKPASSEQRAGKARPPLPVEAVPLTREWLEAVEASGPYVDMSFSRRDGLEVELPGAVLRARAATELCIPIDEDYGWRQWFCFPGRSLSATAHWWVHDAPPMMIGDCFLAADDDARNFYEELESDPDRPWIFSDGDWHVYMALPGNIGTNLIPRFARDTVNLEDCRAVKPRMPRKDGRLQWIKDDARLLASWRLSERIADVSDAEAFLENYTRALQGDRPRPTK